MIIIIIIIPFPILYNKIEMSNKEEEDPYVWQVSPYDKENEKPMHF